MINSNDLPYVIGWFILVSLLILLVIFVISIQQSPKVLKDVCKKCGYKKVTDISYLLDFSIQPIASKIECDKTHIVDLYYPTIKDKWNNNNKFDWNNPIARSC